MVARSLIISSIKKSPNTVRFLQTNGMYILLGIIIIGRIGDFNIIALVCKPILLLLSYIFNINEFYNIIY